MNIKRTNKWDASIVYCKRHMADHIDHLLGGPFTETETDEPCPDCEMEKRYEEAPARMREALLSDECTHTRYRRGSIYAYHRDPGGPSGVRLKATLDEERFDKLYKELVNEGLITSSKSPLSPTEGL